MSDHIPDPVKMVSARDEAVERALMAAWCAPIKGVTDEDAFLTALAAGFVIEQGWQPIETAPMDGTRFIAWWQPCAQVPDGRWHECQWTGGGWYHPFFAEPTHWKPPPVDGPHLAAAKETQA